MSSKDKTYYTFERMFLSPSYQEFNNKIENFLINPHTDISTIVTQVNKDKLMFDYLFCTPLKYKVMRNTNIFIDYHFKQIVIAPYFKSETEVTDFNYIDTSYAHFYNYCKYNLTTTPSLEFMTKINENKLLLKSVYKFFGSIIESKIYYTYDSVKPELIYDYEIISEIDKYFEDLHNEIDPIKILNIKNHYAYYIKSYSDKTKNIDFNENFNFYLNNPNLRTGQIFKWISLINIKRSLFDYVIYTPFMKKLSMIDNVYVDTKFKKIVLFPIFNSMDAVSSFDINEMNNQVNYFHFENYLFNNLSNKPEEKFLQMVNSNKFLFLYVFNYYNKYMKENKHLVFNVMRSKLTFAEIPHPELINEFETWFTDDKLFPLNKYIFENIQNFPKNNFLKIVNVNGRVFDYITRYPLISDILKLNKYLQVDFQLKKIYRKGPWNPEIEWSGRDDDDPINYVF